MITQGNQQQRNFGREGTGGQNPIPRDKERQGDKQNMGPGEGTPGQGNDQEELLMERQPGQGERRPGQKDQQKGNQTLGGMHQGQKNNPSRKEPSHQHTQQR